MYISRKDIVSAYKYINSPKSDKEKDNYLLKIFAKIDFDRLRSQYANYKIEIKMIREIEARFNKINEVKEESTSLELLSSKEISFNKTYKITNAELKLRIAKLEEIGKCFERTNNDLILADTLYKHYKSPSKILTDFSLMIKYGSEDSRLDSIRSYFAHLMYYSSKLEEYIKNGTVKHINGLIKEENRLNNIKDFNIYAEYILQEYMKSDEYWLYRFQNQYGISWDDYAECKLWVKENNPVLFDAYMIEKDKKEKQRIQAVKCTFDILAEAIVNGYFSDGTKLDKLEYLKRTPIKSFNINQDSINFMRIHNDPNVLKTIDNYLSQNGINHYCFQSIDIDSLKVYGYPIGGTLLLKDDIDVIVHYLYERKVRICKETFREAVKMYINGLYNANTVNMNSTNPLKKGLTITPLLPRTK